MYDITHIGLVDAEAECVGGDDQRGTAGGEAALDGRARGAAHARVVALSRDAGVVERLGGLVHGAARAGVDDAGLAAAFARVGDQPGEPLPGAGDRRHLEAQVRAVEAGQHLAGLGGDAEPGEDVTPHGRVRGRRERERARPAELLARAAERQVVGAEVVPPLRDAVRLVDHEQAHTAAREAIEEAPVREPLRCDEEQRDASRLEVGVAAVLLGAIERGVDEGRRDSDRLERLDLVLHQRDQRRDHERAAHFECGQHVAEALAAAGRHHPEHVVRRERLEHLGLAGPEIGVAEALLQQLAVAHGVARQVGHRRPRRDGGRGALSGCLGQRVGRERQGRLRLRGRVCEPVRVGGRDGRSLLDWRRFLGQRAARGAEGPIGRPRRIAVKAAHGRILAQNARSRTCECAFAASVACGRPSTSCQARPSCRGRVQPRPGTRRSIARHPRVNASLACAALAVVEETPPLPVVGVAARGGGSGPAHVRYTSKGPAWLARMRPPLGTFECAYHRTVCATPPSA